MVKLFQQRQYSQNPLMAGLDASQQEPGVISYKFTMFNRLSSTEKIDEAKKLKASN